MEVEWKYLAACEDDGDRLLAQCQALGWTASSRGVRALLDTYYDTQGLALLRSGQVLRRRVEDGAHKMTLKNPGSQADGLFRREELEGPVDEDGEWYLREHGLLPTLSLRNSRRVFDLTLGETQVELALDKVFYRRGARNAGPDYQVELELKSPEGEEALEALGRALKALPFLTPMTQSKYQRGMALTGC